MPKVQLVNSVPALKIIPLGGLKEIGKNTWVFEINDEIMLLDGGLTFPEGVMPGINVILPDTTYIRQNKHKIKGMIVTHGHEDHIGAIPFYLKQFDIPVIYGPRLAMALLEDKLQEAGVGRNTELRRVLPRDVVRVGNSFFVEFIRNTHSISDSFSVAINTPAGLVIHSGDFKMDFTPVDNEHFDLARLAEHGEKGVLCLISDSTNAEVPGHTPSERTVYPNLERIISTAKGRVILTTFASSVPRIAMVLEIAEKCGRVVSVVGRSMLNVIAHARNLGYIKCPDSLLQPIRNTRSYPDDRVLILTTGSQGEPMSALTRMANESYKELAIKPGDTVIFSASPIPGNTIPVVRTIDKLMALGATVYYGKEKGLHVSGHGSQEDQKLMLALTKPKFFFPAHGELRMLLQHAKMAQAMGIPEENIVIANNGDVVEVCQNHIKVVDKVPAGVELVDSAHSTIVKGDILRDRQQISSDGIITVAISLGANGKLIAEPAMELNGVALPFSTKELLNLFIQTISSTLDNRWGDYVHQNGRLEIDEQGLKLQLQGDLEKALRHKLQSRPLITVLLQIPSQAVSQPIPETNGKSGEETTPAGGRRKRSIVTV
ncbi:MAG: ribonuclease J [Pseudanabaenaceae cyanobacterium]